VTAASEEMDWSVAACGVQVVTSRKAAEQMLFPAAADDPRSCRSLCGDASNSLLQLFNRLAAFEVEPLQLTTEIGQVYVGLV